MKPTADTATDKFSLSGGRLFSFLILRHCFRTLVSTALAGLLLIAAGLALDLRLAVVGFMIWCILLPMLIFWCWVRYVLTPVNALNLQPHTLSISAEGIKVTIFPAPPVPDDNSQADENSQAAKNSQTEGITPEPKHFYYSTRSISGAEPFASGMFLHIDAGSRKASGWLYVPTGVNLEALHLRSFISQA